MLLLQLPSGVALLGRGGCAATGSVWDLQPMQCVFQAQQSLFNNLNIVMKCHVGLLTFLRSFVSEFLEGQFSEHDFHF